MIKKIAVYPGTFDPFTYGHLDVVRRASKMFEKIIISVAESSNKTSLFNVKERKEIIKFIEFCKSFENDNGYIDASFFKTMISKRAQFVSGPFTNMIFEILEKQKNKLKILIGNIVMTISDNKNYCYRSV